MKRKESIVERMALLREQRNLIKSLHSIHEEDEVIKSDVQKQFKAFLGMSSDTDVLVHLRKFPILLSDKAGTFPKSSQETGYYGRASKIATLLQSCIDSGFIIQVENVLKGEHDKHTYYKISDKGSDLLHILGFCQIAFEKYSKIIVFFWGVLSVMAIKALTSIISHWETIKSTLFS